MIKGLGAKLALGLGLGIIVVLAMAWAADVPTLASSLSRWRWQFLPLVLGAVLANYALRFLRWHYYLGVANVRDVSVRDSLAIFLSGFSLTMTPGKLGEVLKSFLLKQIKDVPVSYSASLVAAERLTDVLAMVILAALGLGAFQIGWQPLAAVTIGSLAFVVIVQQQSLCRGALDRAGRLPVVGRFAGVAANLYSSAYLLLCWRPLVVAIILGTLAWFAECLAFYVVIAGLGVAATPSLLLQATFIYAIASLLGAVSFLPGGLGATEGSMAVMLTQIAAMERDAAIAATLLVRFATLWFAVLLGLAALVLFQRRVGGR